MSSWTDYIRSPLGGTMRRTARGAGGAPTGYSTAYEGTAPPDSAAYNIPGYDQRAGSYQQFADERGGGPFRGQQEALANLLMRQAQGQDSLSAEQLRQGLGQLQAQQMSTMAGARPSNAALASRTASQNMGNVGAQMAGNQAMAGIAERNAASQALGGVLGQARGQDIGAYLGANQLSAQEAQNQQQAQFGREQIRANRYGTAMQSPSVGEVTLGALQGFGGLLAMSDRRAKENIAKLPVYTYHFKGSGAPHAGPMAQEVEAVAPDAVVDTPVGKAIDLRKGAEPIAEALRRHGIVPLHPVGTFKRGMDRAYGGGNRPLDPSTPRPTAGPVTYGRQTSPLPATPQEASRWRVETAWRPAPGGGRYLVTNPDGTPRFPSDQEEQRVAARRDALLDLIRAAHARGLTFRGRDR